MLLYSESSAEKVGCRTSSSGPAGQGLAPRASHWRSCYPAPGLAGGRPILFIFDPVLNAVLLVADDKSGPVG